MAAEGLHADDRADQVAVDVDVAGGDAFGDQRDGLVDARVQSEGERVARVVDGVHERLEIGAPVTQHVQHRAEHLALHLGDVADLDERRRHEGAARRRSRQRQLLDAAAAGAHRFDVALDVLLGLARDDRADVGGEAIGIVDDEFAQRAPEHDEHALGDVLLQAQDAQRRAALAGAVERGGEHVADHLLGQRRGIDDQRVLAAGLRDQRHRLARRSEPRGELALDQARDGGRAGEHHAAHALVGDQRRADIARAGQQLQRTGRHAGLEQQLDGHRRDQRRFFGGLGEHRVARRQRRGHLAGEDRQREIPGRDAHHWSQRAVRVVAEVRARLRAVVAQEIDRLADLGDGVRQRLARFAHDEREQFGAARLEALGRAPQCRGALGRRRGRPGGRCGQGCGAG